MKSIRSIAQVHNCWRKLISNAKLPFGSAKEAHAEVCLVEIDRKNSKLEYQVIFLEKRLTDISE